MDAMNVIPVDTGIPLMPSQRNSYPYRSMAVGDSFYVANRSLGTMRTSNSRAGKALGRKFVAKGEGEGIRVWRVA
jgi:hypothetical protein